MVITLGDFATSCKGRRQIAASQPILFFIGSLDSGAESTVTGEFRPSFK
jgi:hypothetical protein